MTSITFKKRKSVRRCRKKNAGYQKAYRQRLQSMKANNVDLYERTKAPLKRRHENASRTRSRVRKDPKYAFFRFRKFFRHAGDMYESFFVQKNEGGDLRKLMKPYRKCTRKLDIPDAQEVDRIREFLHLHSIYRFFLPPDAEPRTFKYRGLSGDVKSILIPTFSEDCMKTASEKSFMVHEGTIYHNDFRSIVNKNEDLDFQIRYTKRCDQESFYEISMEHWLQEYDLTHDDIA